MTIPIDIAEYRDRLPLLTLRQIQCLLLVEQGYQSKEIARFLEISVGRVQAHILNARRTLGGPPRREAARLVATYEAELAAAGQGGQSLSALSLPLAPLLELPHLLDEADDSVATVVPCLATDQPTPAQHLSEPSPTTNAFIFQVPLRSDRRPSNDLSARPTLLTIAVISAAGLVAAGSAMQLLVTFQNFLD